MNLSTVKSAQWDKSHKTQSRELLGLFICVCSSLCTIVAHNIAQNRPDNFPSYPPDNHHFSTQHVIRLVKQQCNMAVYISITSSSFKSSIVVTRTHIECSSLQVHIRVNHNSTADTVPSQHYNFALTTDLLCEIFSGCQWMAKVPNAVEILPKIWTTWVGRTSVTDRQRRQTDGRQHSERERLVLLWE